MENKLLKTGLFLGGLSIIMGAFGAHLFKQYLTENQLYSFEIGVRYQMYHALFLLFLSQTNRISTKVKHHIFITTFIGVLFFSGSIFMLSFKNYIPFSVRFLGPITPFGGALLIFSWFYAGFKINFATK